MDRTAVLQKIKQAADTNATELDLSGMELTEIPEEIAQLTNLSELYLDHNRISAIPDSIVQLTNLSELELSSNQIRVIPDSISQLINLSYIGFYSNQINVIPDSISQLINLSYIDLSYNSISEIPESIAQLSKPAVIVDMMVPGLVDRVCKLSVLDVKKRGVLTLPDLPNILKQIDRYPESKRPFLMGLLEKFELCFKLADYTPDRYLITDLLPIDEPDIDPYETASLHFQYHYEISPSSIISRFIVRNHTMIYKTMLWRSGAVLTQDLAKALVRADDEDTFISIKVQGNRANALLSTLRADFDKIHRTIPHLAVREYLVIREFDKGEYTDREVPVDYNYLCDLDRQRIATAPLPNLKGTYNLRDLLEGVESYDQRQANLDDRLDRSYKTRDSRKLTPLPKPEKPSLFKTSALMLFILAIVSAILAVTTHFIPGLQPASIFIGFFAVVLTVLLLTGNITEGTFSKILDSFFNASSNLTGKDAETPKLPEDPKE